MTKLNTFNHGRAGGGPVVNPVWTRPPEGERDSEITLRDRRDARRKRRLTRLARLLLSTYVYKFYNIL